MTRALILAALVVGCGDVEDVAECGDAGPVACTCPGSALVGSRACDEPDEACVCPECLEGQDRPLWCQDDHGRGYESSQVCVAGMWSYRSTGCSLL
jgi:hypothetical protein